VVQCESGASDAPRHLSTGRRTGGCLGEFLPRVFGGQRYETTLLDHPTRRERPPGRTPQCRKVFTARLSLPNYCEDGANGVKTVRLVLQRFFRPLKPRRFPARCSLAARCAVQNIWFRCYIANPLDKAKKPVTAAARCRSSTFLRDHQSRAALPL